MSRILDTESKTVHYKNNHLNENFEKFEEENIYIYIFFVNITIIGSTF